MSSCDVFNCLFPLDVQNEIQLLSRVLSCRLSKSSENPVSHGIVLKNELTQVHLAWYVRGLKSPERFWPYLMAFSICISTGNALVSGKHRTPIPGKCGTLAGDFSRFRPFFSPRCAGFSTTFRRKYRGAGTKSRDKKPGQKAGLRRGFAFDAILNIAKITGRTCGLTSPTMVAESKKKIFFCLQMQIKPKSCVTLFSWLVHK